MLLLRQTCKAAGARCQLCCLHFTSSGFSPDKALMAWFLNQKTNKLCVLFEASPNFLIITGLTEAKGRGRWMLHNTLTDFLSILSMIMFSYMVQLSIFSDCDIKYMKMLPNGA